MNLKLLISKNLEKKINSNTYLIIGSARSGTSIIGNLIASFKNAEYFYEPELLKILFLLSRNLKKKILDLIFNTYLYIDLIKNSLNNRRINLNKKDQFGYFFRYKDNKDLLTKNYFDIFKKNSSFKYKVFVKLPSSFDEVNYFFKKKKFKIIYIKRNDFDVICSLLKKKWFSTKSNRFFPSLEYKNKTYPYFLKKNELKNWNKLNEYEKCAIYLLKIKKSIFKKKNIKILSYDDLVNDKIKFFNKLKKLIKLKPTKKTFIILKQIKKNSKNNNWVKDKINKKILKKLDKYDN